MGSPSEFGEGLIGAVLLASVVEVTDYGLWVEVDGVTGLVLLPELSWERITHPSAVASVGEWVRLVVVHLPEGETRARFTGSIRQLQPERNPWRDPSLYVVGETFVGEVVSCVGYGCFVRHPERAEALLPSVDMGDRVLAVGDRVTAVIVAVEAEKKKLRVRLV